jgi:hypothetical protein
MPQPKVHKNNAQRQAAYRRRKGPQKVTQAELAMLARGLHGVIQTAVVYEDFPLPHELAAARPEQTIRNLIRFFDVVYDPVRNPNGRHKRRPEAEEMEDTKTDKIQL